MADSHTFNIGGVSGGQNNFGGNDNVFNQQNVHGLDPARFGELLQQVRRHLADFADPEAAGQELATVERATPADLTRPGRARAALDNLLRYARPGTEALTALTTLVTAVRGVTG